MGPLVIVGPGTLGRSLARHAAEKGLEVRLVGRDLAHAEKGIEAILSGWQKAVGKGNADSEALPLLANRIMASERVRTAIEGAAAIIEALPEDLAAKAAFWRSIGPLTHDNLLTLTGSSCIPASLIRREGKLAPGLQNFHPFVPVARHPIVELGSPPDTPDSLLLGARELAAALGLRVAPIQESLGLAASRMGLAQGLEAMRLLQKGHGSAEDIDALMTMGYGHPCGPLELSDRIGLDLRLSIAEFLFQASGDPIFSPPEILRRKVGTGNLGRKSGEGFYTWSAHGTRA